MTAFEFIKTHYNLKYSDYILIIIVYLLSIEMIDNFLHLGQISHDLGVPTTIKSIIVM